MFVVDLSQQISARLNDIASLNELSMRVDHGALYLLGGIKAQPMGLEFTSIEIHKAVLAQTNGSSPLIAEYEEEIRSLKQQLEILTLHKDE